MSPLVWYFSADFPQDKFLFRDPKSRRLIHWMYVASIHYLDSLWCLGEWHNNVLKPKHEHQLTRLRHGCSVTPWIAKRRKNVIASLSNLPSARQQPSKRQKTLPGADSEGVEIYLQVNEVPVSSTVVGWQRWFRSMRKLLCLNFVEIFIFIHFPLNFLRFQFCSVVFSQACNW